MGIPQTAPAEANRTVMPIFRSLNTRIVVVLSYLLIRAVDCGNRAKELLVSPGGISCSIGLSPSDDFKSDRYLEASEGDNGRTHLFILDRKPVEGYCCEGLQLFCA